jgi:hypothetical protein
VRERFGNDPSRIESWINAWALTDYFRRQQFDGDLILGDDGMLRGLGEALKLFWSLRLKTLFPTREFLVEMGDDLEGDDGLAVTFYETPNSVRKWGAAQR